MIKKNEIQDLLANEGLLRRVCIAVVEKARKMCIIMGQMEDYNTLNHYSPDEYIEFARKNLKEKLSKM